MARIKNFVIPPNLAEQLIEMAQELPEDLVRTWGRTVLPGGFTRVEAIRERLVARLRSENVIEGPLMDVLAWGLPYRPTIASLSLGALQEVYPTLEGLIGRDPLLLALLVDEREHVHKWAVELASKPAAGPPISEELAETAFNLFLDKRFVDPLMLEPLFPAEDRGAPPPLPISIDDLTQKALAESTEKIETQRKTIEHLNNELQLQKQRHLARLKEQADAAEREKKTLRAELATAQNQGGALRKHNQELEHKVKELGARMDAAVAERLREQTSALVRKWLTPALELETALEKQGARPDDLAQRVERALEAQARQDRHTGNRLELERRLQSLQSARDRLLAAQQNALTPVSELKPLLAELETEIARLQKLLTGAKPVSDTCARLLATINAAGWEDLRALSQLVDQIADAALVPSEESRALYGAVQRRFSRLEENTRVKPAEGDTGWSLRDTIFRNKSALLLLDGHNVLYGLPDIFSPDYENGHPQQKARQRLVNIVGKLLKDRTNIKAKICFDGPDARSLPVLPHVTVEYSGGTGSNRADDMIVNRLQFKDLDRLDQKVFVVTDDRQIRHEVLKTGAKFVRTSLFAVLLADFQALS